MYLAISFVMAVVPALLLVIYYYRKDAAKPEPKGLIVKVFILGIASIIPALLIELLLGLIENILKFIPLLAVLFKSFVIAALCEELIKLLVVKRYAYRDIHFDEIMDGIVYTVVASLGFACFENVMYVINNGMTVAVLRAFTAVPMHAFASGIMGYYVGLAKFSPDREKKLMLKGLFYAVIIHGIYDFLLFSIPVFVQFTGSDLGSLFSLGIIPLLITSFFILRRKIKCALDVDLG